MSDAPVTRPDLDTIRARATDAKRNRDSYGKDSRSRRITNEASAEDVPVLLAALAAERARAEQAQQDADAHASDAQFEREGRRKAEQRIAEVKAWRDRYAANIDSRYASEALDASLSAAPTTEQGADEWCREERCEYRHWTSGDMPTHKRGHRCPTPTAEQGV